MSTAATREDRDSRSVQIREEHYARLKRYFLGQTDDPSEADNFVRETVRRFFESAKGRRDEAAGCVFARLMRIALRLCMES